jgi:predicted nucleic acid binding AN1-type Zn finger protein
MLRQIQLWPNAPNLGQSGHNAHDHGSDKSERCKHQKQIDGTQIAHGILLSVTVSNWKRVSQNRHLATGFGCALHSKCEKNAFNIGTKLEKIVSFQRLSLVNFEKRPHKKACSQDIAYG